MRIQRRRLSCFGREEISAEEWEANWAREHAQPASGETSSWNIPWADLAKIGMDLIHPPTVSPPPSPIYVTPSAPTGLSTGAILGIAGAGIGAVLLAVVLLKK